MTKAKLELVIKKMIKEKKSIREMARELEMPKSTLYKEIVKNKEKISKRRLKQLEKLFEENKKGMAQKGGIAKREKVRAMNVSIRN